MRRFTIIARRHGPNAQRGRHAADCARPATDAAAPKRESSSRIGFTNLFVAGSDGLGLHVGCYGAPVAGRAPVVCLPGFARTGADYDCVALALAHNPIAPRQVLVLDYRGHGRSDYDRDPGHYGLDTDFADLSSVLTALEIPRAVFIGTCHGGLLILLLAASRPAAVAGAILNDIGPVVEPQGLFRIKSYVDKLPTPRSYPEGADILRSVFHSRFPQLTDADWLGLAQRTWRESGGSLVLDYDRRIVRALARANLESPPTLWNQFDALARVPLLVIRGAKSDMLSAATLTAMLARRTELEVVVVPGQGHPPLLVAPALIQRIVRFVASCDRPAA
jgi:pimeloyl-ACP methyl ester carboxylesterase